MARERAQCHSFGRRERSPPDGTFDLAKSILSLGKGNFHVTTKSVKNYLLAMIERGIPNSVSLSLIPSIFPETGTFVVVVTSEAGPNLVLVTRNRECRTPKKKTSDLVVSMRVTDSVHVTRYQESLTNKEVFQISCR